MDISFDCDKCGKHLVVDEAGAGITIDCPGCGKPVYVPHPTSRKPSAPPARVQVKSTPTKTAPVSQPKAAGISPSSGKRRTGWSPPTLVAKYGALRTIASICQFMAVPTGAVYVLAAILALKFYTSLPDVYGPMAIIPVIAIGVVGVFSVIGLLAAAESIRVFIDIEENTRATRLLMEQDSRSKYEATSLSTGAPAAAVGTTSQPPKSYNQVHFPGPSSR